MPLPDDLPPLQVARVLEQHCIGCTLCIEACPVDAIVGANKRMHAVLTDHCTGCGLCAAPCPVDCIVMEPARPARAWTQADAELAWQRRQARLARASKPAQAELDDAERRKRAVLDTALARARARRASAIH